MKPTDSGNADLRAALEADLERTRESFRQLIQSLTDARWANRAPGSRWSGKQLMHHVTWALEQLPQEVESARRGKGMFNYPKFLADNGSYWLVKWEARKETRDSILARYGLAMDTVLVSLGEITDDDWERGARFYGERFYSVGDLYHTPANHFQEHAATLL